MFEMYIFAPPPLSYIFFSEKVFLLGKIVGQIQTLPDAFGHDLKLA